ncbi:MAG: DnaJ domain-containing protein [Arcobacteraceae bacterium]|nr:DnaJ domain-containing protein [Arcobacteraceae bacterium]
MEIIIFIVVVIIFVLLNKDYHKQDFRHIKVNIKQTLQGDLSEHEAGLLIALMAKVAKADGGVCELEAELLSNIFTDISLVFENDKEIREELKKIYNREKESFENTIEVSKKYFKLTKSDYQKRLRVMEYLLNLAFIDGEFSKTEYMIIEDISNAIEIKKADLDVMIQRFEAYINSKKNQAQMNLSKAYETLEINESASSDEIKKQYRKLVKQYHPDVITGQGADQATIDKATNKLQDINEAYEIIKAKKGV